VLFDTLGSIHLIMIILMIICILVTGGAIAIISYVSQSIRSKEIGIMRSLGTRSKDIITIFSFESMIIGFIAGIIGTIIALYLIPKLNVMFIEIIYIKTTFLINNFIIFIVLISSVVISLIFGLLPSISASKIKPIKAIKK
jgi:putative ABC transport system permease protein